MKLRRKLTESEFTTQIIEYAALHGWLITHFRPARSVRGWRTPLQGNPGFPDLVLCRGDRIIFAELKVGYNQPTEGQAQWLRRLSECAGIEVAIWRPADWSQIEATLRGE